MQEDASYPDLYRLVAACYAHKSRLDDTREIVMRLRAITPVVMPPVGHLRNAPRTMTFPIGPAFGGWEEK
jgi:hypothetical protein